jgi:hypothetical protein
LPGQLKINRFIGSISISVIKMMMGGADAAPLRPKRLSGGSEKAGKKNQDSKLIKPPTPLTNQGGQKVEGR